MMDSPKGWLKPLTHEDKVNRICSLLRSRVGKEPIRFERRGVSHKVPKPGSRRSGTPGIDISDLDRLLSIDPESMTCEAEPGLPFYDLVRETLKLGLAPACVPELKTITVGGAVAGCSVESMSFKNGGFHDSCLEYEVVTSRGEALTCRRDDEDPLLFEMQHGAFGTLGLITKLKFQLLPAKSFVHVLFERYESLADYLAAIRCRVDRRDADFVDGLILSPRAFVLCVGNFVDKAPFTHSYQWMRVYHKAAASMREDYLSTYDYYFRYDADCHWIARNYGLENPLLRLVLGRLFLSSTRMLGLAAFLSPLLSRMRPEVVVDLFLPFSEVEGFLDFYEREFSYYPLWAVPYWMPRPYPWLAERYSSGASDGLYLDLAVYGFRPDDSRNYYRLLEEELGRRKGVKTLISHNFYTRDEFWGVWNRANYQAVKGIVDPDGAFRDLYDKTCGL
jgi:FAD/FMN-containing dehydrogenase